MFFITERDPRARVKGSRDPLGFQAVWTRFGREVVGNLTTVTTSVRNFTTLLLGLYFADAIITQDGRGEASRANLFLKFEQLAAYSRFAYADQVSESTENPRGYRRVAQRLHELSGRVRISADPAYQILSDQKTYGIWGLYTNAARQCGMVEHGENRLTPAAQEFVEREYLPHLSFAGARAGASVLKLLLKDSNFEPRGQDRRLGRALSEALSGALSPRERDYYRPTLVFGGDGGSDRTRGRQRRLWEHIAELNESGRFGWQEEFSYQELKEIIKRETRDGVTPLSRALDAIHIIEPVLAVSGILFGFLLLRRDAHVAEAVREVRAAWGTVAHIDAGRVESLIPDIAAAVGDEQAGRIVKLARFLAGGDYSAWIRLAAEQNADVMRLRGGLPWLSVEGRRLKVRANDEGNPLLPQNELPTLWVSTYFINSLKAVGRTVMGRAG